MLDTKSLAGWLRADVEAAKLQRELEQAMVSLSGRTGRVRGRSGSEATADLAADSIGRGIARSYQEEQRLISENSRLRAQLEVMTAEGFVDAIAESRELRRRIEALEGKLESAQREHEEKLLHAENRVHALQGELAERETSAARAARDAADLSDKLSDALARMSRAEGERDAVQQQKQALQLRADASEFAERRAADAESTLALQTQRERSAAAAAEGKDAQIEALGRDASLAAEQATPLSFPSPLQPRSAPQILRAPRRGLYSPRPALRACRGLRRAHERAAAVLAIS
jgi:chromosome segregation ATPase